MLKGQNKSVKCAKIRDIWNNPRELWLFREAVISVLVTLRVFSDTWGFPIWLTDALFLFPSCQKNLDYVRILRRNNWIVRSQKFRISDGWVQNLTTVPGIGQKCTKMVVSKIRQTGPNSDTSIWFSTPLFNIRTLSSHFEQYRPISDSIVSFGTTVKFLALPSRFRHNPSDF